MNFWHSYRDEVKSLYSCIDVLRDDGIYVSRTGQAIVCPPFIRAGSDSKSFAVYDDLCIDYVTGQHYDQISLRALARFDGDLTAALEDLAGRKLPSKFAHQHDQLFNDQQATFSERVNYWHQELLKNPEVDPLGGNPIHILDYLAERGIFSNDIITLKLGYSPKTKRLMIPYFNRNHQPCYAAGRIMEFVPKGDNRPKYSYLKLDDPEFDQILDKVIFGIDSIKPRFRKFDEVYDQEQGQVVKLDTYPFKNDYLAVCEGLFDVLSFRCDGWDAITGKISAKQEKEFLDICRMYRDNGKKIFICFDNDKAGESFQRKMADLLFRNGIPFVAGHLPKTIRVSSQYSHNYGHDISVKDVSDYYSAGGSLEELVKSARDGMTEIAYLCKNEDDLQQRFLQAARAFDRWHVDRLKKAALSVVDIEVETDTDINGDIVRENVPKYRFNDKSVKFLYSEAMRPLQDCDIAKFVEKRYQLTYDTLGQFYEYRHGVWEAMNDLLIQQKIIRVMNGHISAQKVSGVCKFLKMDLADSLQFNTKHNIVFQNGTLWLDEQPKKFDLADQTAHNPYFDQSSPLYHMPSNFKKHSPDDMSTIQLDYCYDPNAHNEALERAAREWTNHKDGSPDDEKYRLLKQIFGYILFVKNTLQKFIILKGDGSNGKSACMHCIEAILGKKNTTSLQISRLSSEFDPILLKNSRVNLSYDAQSSIEEAQETLKALIGGDSITAAHKGVDAESFTTNAKFIVSANKFFSANDVSRGLLRRMLFIAFNNEFKPKAGEPSIEDEIMQDLPGLFNFAYEGYKDLMQAGYFCETAEQIELLEEFREQLSPLILFAKEELYSLEDTEFAGTLVYRLYREWCKSNGEKPMSRTKFIPEIRQVIRTDGVIPEPYKDTDSNQWVFVFPSRHDDEEKTVQQEAGQDTQERVPAHTNRQEVQEVSKSYEQTAQESVEESASVHTAPVSGVQKEQQAKPAEKTPVESRQSSKPLPEQVDPAKKRELEKQKELQRLKTEAEAEKRQGHIDGYRVKVPDPETDFGFKYNESKARDIFWHLKHAGRQWQEKLQGKYCIRSVWHDECFEYEEDINEDAIKNLAVYLKKNPELRVFLPGIEGFIDFGEEE